MGIPKTRPRRKPVGGAESRAVAGGGPDADPRWEPLERAGSCDRSIQAILTGLGVHCTFTEAIARHSLKAAFCCCASIGEGTQFSTKPYDDPGPQKLSEDDGCCRCHHGATVFCFGCYGNHAARFFRFRPFHGYAYSARTRRSARLA